MAVPLTRFSVEVTMIARCRGPMTAASMAVTATNGTPNPDLNDPIASALEELGSIPNDRTAVGDGDVGLLGGPIQSRFLDLTEIRVLETALQALVVKPGRERWEKYERQSLTMSQDITNLIEAKRKRYLARYAQSGPPVVAPLPNAIRGQIHTGGYRYPFDRDCDW